MGLSTDPDWEPWTLGHFQPEECGGHIFIHSDVQITDARRLAEKAHRSTGKFQVLHHHEQGSNCNDQCEALGEEVPRLARG